jgi:hypothetical protein
MILGKGTFCNDYGWLCLFCLNFLRGSTGTSRVVGKQSCQTNTKIKQW